MMERKRQGEKKERKRNGGQGEEVKAKISLCAPLGYSKTV